MKERAKASSTSLFLMELILSILIFSIAAAICVSAFAKSHQLSRESLYKNQAVTASSGMVELIRSCRSQSEISDISAAAYPHCAVSSDSIQVWYDAEGAECAEGDAAFAMDTRISVEEGMLKAEISYEEVNTDAEPFYSLLIDHYIGEEAEA